MAERPAILFDLDGTLADTLPDLATAVDQAMTHCGRSPRGQTEIGEWIGNGLDLLLARALTGTMDGVAEAADMAVARDAFSAYYLAHLWVHSTLYDGVLETLSTLRDRGYLLAVVTNKPMRFTEGLLRQSELAPFFPVVVGGDSLPVRKPDPAPLLHALAALDADRGAATVVGDSINDIRAARAAGLPAIAMTYGYNHGHDIRAARPDLVLDRFAELLTWLPGRASLPRGNWTR